MHSRRTLPNGDPDPTDTSKQRPDLVIYDFHNGGPNPTLVDITVTHPTARCHSRLPERIGVAARSRELMKNRKYRALAVDKRLLLFLLPVPPGKKRYLKYEKAARSRHAPTQDFCRRTAVAPTPVPHDPRAPLAGIADSTCECTS
jgi:hypothetical protein